MKSYAVLDKEGKIVAAGYMDWSEPEVEDAPFARAGPVAEAGQTVVELDVPDEYAKLLPADFIGRLQVDAQAKLAEAE